MGEDLRPDDLYLGVDGGGTKTLAVIARPDGTVLAVGKGGPTSPDFAGPQESGESIDCAIEHAMQTAGVDVKGFQLGVFSGPGSFEGIDRWRYFIREATGISEGPPALACAGVSYGLVVIAGTGSGAGLSNMDGHLRWAGGWGPIIGDEGSGYWIACEALRQVAKSSDRREVPSELALRAMTHFGVEHPRQIADRLYGPSIRRQHIAAFCREVISASQTDPIAKDVLDRAVTGLIDFALTALSDIPKDEAIPVVLTGGVFHTKHVRKLFERRIHESYPKAQVILPSLAPAVGTLLWGWQKLGYFPSQEVISRLSETFKEKEATQGVRELRDIWTRKRAA